jgi:hypothetical protein
VGSARLGAKVLAIAADETIWLNDTTPWSGAVFRAQAPRPHKHCRACYAQTF